LWDQGVLPHHIMYERRKRESIVTTGVAAAAAAAAAATAERGREWNKSERKGHKERSKVPRSTREYSYFSFGAD
jgi:hypothetical protein